MEYAIGMILTCRIFHVHISFSLSGLLWIISISERVGQSRMRRLFLSGTLPALSVLAQHGKFSQEILTGKGFPYGQIKDSMLGKATPVSAEECQAACYDNPKCVAWEKCEPLGDGCDGCYMVLYLLLQFDI